MRALTLTSPASEERNERVNRRALTLTLSRKRERGFGWNSNGVRCDARVYWQPENLNDANRVLQLNAPFAFRYSVVYQNVQSSTGSIDIAL